MNDSKPLYDHQQEAVDFLASRDYSGALIHDPGCGKTRVVLESIRLIPQDCLVLVVCPISIIEAAWAVDIKEWTPELTYHNYHKGKKFDWSKRINIINYESLRVARNAEAVKLQALRTPMMCVTDESSKFKAPGSQITKVLLDLAPLFRYRLILSGTPTPNSELEWWSQINFVEPGRLYANFNKFKNSFFHLARNGQVQNMQGVHLTRKELQKRFQTGWKYEISAQHKKYLLDLIAPVCSVAKKADCLDLPEQIDQVRDIEMNPEQKRIYKDLKTQLVAEINGEFVVARNVLTKLMKLREVTSGFCFDESGGVQDFGSKKFAELETLLDDIDGQVIIWGNYKYEMERIAEIVGKKRTTGLLYSKTKDRDQTIKDFIEGKIDVLVAHPASAAHGLTFVNCSVQIFFSLSYSAEQYTQARARTHRSGQKNVCTYIHLICKDTIDVDILKIVQRKISEQDAVINIIKGA